MAAPKYLPPPPLETGGYSLVDVNRRILEIMGALKGATACGGYFRPRAHPIRRPSLCTAYAVLIRPAKIQPFMAAHYGVGPCHIGASATKPIGLDTMDSPQPNPIVHIGKIQSYRTPNPIGSLQSYRSGYYGISAIQPCRPGYGMIGPSSIGQDGAQSERIGAPDPYRARPVIYDRILVRRPQSPRAGPDPIL